MSRLFEALSSLEAERRAAKKVRGPVVAADVDMSDAIGLAAAAAQPALETETDYRSSQGSHLKVVLPEGVAANTAGVDATASDSAQATRVSTQVAAKPTKNLESSAVQVKVSPESRLVALTDPNSLGAEKFRALVTRLDDMHKQRELKSFQVTSSVINEGKTLVSGNVGVTLAKYSGAKTLLIEGDLHRPTLASLFGLNQMRGLGDWWSGQDQELGRFIHKLNDMPLWFLSAGKPCDRPSDVLRSARFIKAFAQLTSQFEWIVVDSSPMLPIVDVNLWSRLVDGTLLVVREGLAPVKALKKGLEALDHPKLIGVVINDASTSDLGDYGGQYYGGRKPSQLSGTIG